MANAFEDRGWRVVRVEIDEQFQADHRDVRTFHWTAERPMLVWGSPPCDEFARDWMPWLHQEGAPSFELAAHVLRVVVETQPRWWVLENVRGAVRWFAPVLGEPRAVHGPFHLWGRFPPFTPDQFEHKKSAMSGSQKAERATVPREIVEALARAIESQKVLA